MARARKPLTKRGLLLRLGVGLSIAIGACPAWHSLDGRWLFPSGSTETGYEMDIAFRDDGTSEFVLHPITAFSIRHLLDWDVRLKIRRSSRAPHGRADRVLGAPVRVTHHFRASWEARSRDPIRPNDLRLDIWFNHLIEQLRRFEATDPGTMDSGDRRMNGLAEVSPDRLAWALRRELDRNPLAITGAVGGFDGYGFAFFAPEPHWPAIRWVGVRASLGVLCFAGLGVAAFAAARIRRVDLHGKSWCARCCYTLDPAMPHCPECGTPIRWPETT